MQVRDFIEDMPAALAEASLVVARAGALTLAELAIMRRPAILIPLPTAADDHQTVNAMAFARAGAALVLPQPDASATRLGDLVDDILRTPDRQQDHGPGHGPAGAARARRTPSSKSWSPSRGAAGPERRQRGGNARPHSGTGAFFLHGRGAASAVRRRQPRGIRARVRHAATARKMHMHGGRSVKTMKRGMLASVAQPGRTSGGARRRPDDAARPGQPRVQPATWSTRRWWTRRWSIPNDPRLAEPDPDADVPPDLGPDDEIAQSYDDGYDPQAYTQFQDALAPYGTWENDDSYGEVWTPAAGVVGANFVPYGTGGHWVRSEYGWTWASDWNWGWAPFHYGRWAMRAGRWSLGARHHVGTVVGGLADGQRVRRVGAAAAARCAAGFVDARRVAVVLHAGVQAGCAAAAVRRAALPAAAVRAHVRRFQ